MACSNVTLKGLAEECTASKGGVKKILIAPYAKVTLQYDTDKAIVTGITGGNFLNYFIRPNSSSMTSTATVDASNGVNYVTTELSAVFVKMDAVKRLELNSILLSDVMALVQDSNGIWYFLGSEEAVTATAATAETGVQKSDGNKITLTLSDSTLGFPPIVADAAVEALITE